MSIFNTLLNMARQSDFTIGVRAIGENKDQISLIFVPAAKDGQEPALSQPVKLSGTVQELEDKFTSELTRVIGARASLIEQVDATVAILDAATQAQASKASASLKKGKPTTTSVSTDDDSVEGSDESSPTTSIAVSSPSQSQPPQAEAGNLFANLT